MKKTLFAVLAVSAAVGAIQPVSAAITWTDWTDATPNKVVGTAGAVGVTYTGSYDFAQTTPSIDYYVGPAFPDPYKPTNTDIVALGAGGTKTITFSQAVTGVYLALVSWNGQNATFGDNFTTVTPLSACGYWGCGTLPASGNYIGNAGEIHGVIRFDGPITSLTFTDASEGWHGITVGFDGVAGVPEPASWAMMIGGFAIAGAALRRRKMAVSFG